MSLAPVIVLAICCAIGWLKWRRVCPADRQAFASFVGMFGIVIVGVAGIFSALTICSQIYGSFIK